MLEFLLIILLLIILGPFLGMLIGGFFNTVGALLSLLFKSYLFFVIGAAIVSMFFLTVHLFSENFLYIFPPILTMIITISYFKREEIKSLYIISEKRIITKANQISQNLILRITIVILLIIIFYLLIFK
jgi:hypothetical protein|tara:strand:+ start:227 stop:613 length:387 start_codon:yes stop_codon:yes gene_type:complete